MNKNSFEFVLFKINCWRKMLHFFTEICVKNVSNLIDQLVYVLISYLIRILSECVTCISVAVSHRAGVACFGRGFQAVIHNIVHLTNRFFVNNMQIIQLFDHNSHSRKFYVFFFFFFRMTTTTIKLMNLIKLQF